MSQNAEVNVENSVVESVNLFYTEGSSDKVYAAQLEKKNQGFVVNFQYGRRGSSLKAGTKTVEPVDLNKARSVFQGLIQEKKAKGYTEAESGERFQDTSLAGRVSGVVPQLLNVIEEKDMTCLLEDKNWWAQEKHDGERRMVIVQGETITGTNREGLSIAMGAGLEKALQQFSIENKCSGVEKTVLDGEDLGDKGYIVFDILEHAGTCLRKKSYEEREAVLSSLVFNDRVRCIKTAKTTKEKKTLLKTLREGNKEGVVLKEHARAWCAGRPASGGSALKFKFVESATVVARKGREGKRSVSIWMLDEKGQEVAVGNVNVPINQAIPSEGALMEVEYLYAYKGGSLYQPVLKGPRPDKTVADQLATLKWRPD